MSPRADSPSWRHAKRTGDDAEIRFAEYWRLRGWRSFHQLGTAPEFDALLTTSVEVKADAMAHRTGNVAIELARDNRASGLTTSEAEFWWIDVGDSAIWVPRSALAELVREGGFPRVSAGDGKRSQCALVPVDVLRGATRAREVDLRQHH